MVTPPRPTGAWASKQWDRKYGGVQKPTVQPSTTTATTKATPSRPTGAWAAKQWDQKYGGGSSPTPAATTETSGGYTDSATGVWTPPWLSGGSSGATQTPAATVPSPASQQQGSQLAEAITPTASTKPTRRTGESWVDWVGRESQWLRDNDMTIHSSGRRISKDPNQWSDDDRSAVYQGRAAELGQAPGEHTKQSHIDSERRRQESQWKGKQEYDRLMEQNWSPERQAEVNRLWGDRQITYDEYMAGAHDMMSDGQGGYQGQGNTVTGYLPDGTMGTYDQRDHPGWTQEIAQEMFAPARHRVARPAEWDQPQQQPPQQQSMAQQYGWGAGLGGQQQQQMPQWGQPPQQQQMPQWGQPAYQTPPSGGRGVGQMGVSGGPMPQWGGAPQQQAMPQWGQMMQQQPMGGPMAGMEAARMGGGAMQQMGGGSPPWASMWGDPFAGRQMTTDPNSPAMGGLPQMDPAQQLLMQMQGMGGGLSGGFGAGGGSSGGGGMSGGMSGGGQTGAAQTGGGDPYGSLASILALFAGGGGGYGGGGGSPAPTHYGGLPRNGLYYADLMRGAGG